MRSLPDKMKDRYNKNRDRVRLIEFCLNVLCGYEIIFTGSLADGPHNDDSDTDLLYVSKDVIAVPDDTSTDYQNENKTVLQTESANVYPGHVKLKLREQSTGKIDILKPKETFKSLCVKDSLILSTKKVLTNWCTVASGAFSDIGSLKQTKEHGPSAQMTLSHSDGTFEFDFVYAVPCSEWPKEARGWFDRKRKSGFPDESLLRRIHALGTYVVPFGRSEDGENSDSDWRISFSHAEREIMWSLEGSQLLCYEIMKRICSIVKAKFPGSIQSYFFKTSFLWNLEGVPKTEWNINDILRRTIICIQWLKKNLVQETVPNYFIPGNNMFRRDTCNRATLQQVVHYLEELTDLDNKVWNGFLDSLHSFFRDDLLFKYHIYLDGLALARQLAVSFAKDPSPQKCLKMIREKILAIQGFSNECNENSFFLPFLEASCQSIVGSLAICVQGTNPGLEKGP